MCQNIDINPIQAKNGYLIFQTGNIDLPTNYEYHCLTVNLTKTEQTYKNLMEQTREFEHLDQIQYLKEKLNREMNGIKIAQRNKRGLANFVGTFYKYLFGTLDQQDREELESKIDNLSENSIQINELNKVIDAINKGIETVNRLNENQNENQRLAILIFNLQEFTEYIEDIELGMQFTRLGIFNPKLLKHDPLKHINSEKLLNIKTSTWLQVNTNEILIISHIPRTIIKTPIYKILPYPDQNQNIITETLHDKYYIKNQQVFKVKTKEIVNNKCIIGLLRQTNTECRYTKMYKNFELNYIEPNIIITWNLPKTLLNQNCINKDLIAEGNNIIKVFNCSIQIEDVIITNTMLDYTRTIYVNNNITKLEPLSYIVAKEIFQNHSKQYFKTQTILLILLVVIIIIIIIYLIYKFKNIPKRIIINYKKQKVITPEEETISSENKEHDLQLYPKLTA